MTKNAFNFDTPSRLWHNEIRRNYSFSKLLLPSYFTTKTDPETILDEHYKFLNL